MPKITQYYGITCQVPFLDVDVNIDNRLYLDPYAVRMGLGPATFVAQANQCTKTFFDEITHCVISPVSARHRRGQELLQRFEEPRETRLGMSAAGFNGHGGADGIGASIWDVLTTDADALVRVGVFKWIEELPLFVHGVGEDITSDLTTRVIFEPLVDFTAEMVKLHPQLAGKTGLKQILRQVWDPLGLIWEEKLVTLPTVDGKPLLLVPKEWVRHGLTLTASRFYDTTLLTHVQLERATYTQDGKVLKTPKYRLREDDRLARSYDTIIRIVEEAYAKSQTNLVADFKAWAKERYEATTDEQISRRAA